MAAKKIAVTTAMSELDKQTCEIAAHITQRNMSEFLRLASTKEAERIIEDTKRKDRTASESTYADAVRAVKAKAARRAEKDA